MEKFTEIFNLVNALGSLGFFLFGFGILYFMFLDKENKIFQLVKKNVLLISFIASILPMIGSLTYSMVLGYEPCTLCWAQRIFMFPTMFMFLMALIYKKLDVFKYTLPLLLIGTLFSIYHNIIYIFDISPILCSATVSCNSIYVSEFGFMTIPLMSLSAFFVLIILSIIGLNRNNQEFSPQ